MPSALASVWMFGWLWASEILNTSNLQLCCWAAYDQVLHIYDTYSIWETLKKMKKEKTRSRWHTHLFLHLLQTNQFKAFNKNLWRESTSMSLYFLCNALIVNLLSSKIRLFYVSSKLCAIAFFKPAAVHWGLCCVEYILRVPLIIIFAHSSNLYQCLYWQSAIFVYGYFYLLNKDACQSLGGRGDKDFALKTVC